MTFTPTSQKQPCTICNDISGKCRATDVGQMCMNILSQDGAPDGWRFNGISKDGMWGMFAPRKASGGDSAPELKGFLSAPERDRLYREILSHLDLSAEDAHNLRARGLTDEQIETGLFRSVKQWQHLPFTTDSRLPGVLRGGRSLNVPGAGFICPAFNQDGQIVGLQLRLREAEKARYRWMSSKTKKNSDGATPHINGELPLTVAKPIGAEGLEVALAEGILKPWIAAQNLNQIFIGASGGIFAASAKTLDATLKALGVRRITFYQDAGAAKNEKVLRRDFQTWDLLRRSGYEVAIAWWGQTTKDSPDCDELSGEEDIQMLTVEQYEEMVAPRPSEVDTSSATDTPKKAKKEKLPSESEIAWDLERELEGRIIFSEQHDSWFMYEAESPGAWAPVKDGAIRQLIIQHIKELVGTGLYEGCSSRYIAGIHNLLRDDGLRVPNFNEAIAKKKHLIGFRNGVYNLHDQIFVGSHDPQNYLLSTLPRDYAPLARQWDEIFEWLNWVFDGNREYIDTFNCVAAAIMRRMSSLQVFPHLKGIGGGGKSVALKLLATLVGEKNTVSSSLEDIATNRFETARLVGKLLCLMPDQDNWHGSIGNFLKLTGRDLVRIERKNKDGGEFLFEGFVAISSNPDVFTSRTGRELTRRQLLMPFTKDVGTPDPHFAERLASGMHGWTNYLMSLSEEFIIKTLQGTNRKAITPDQWESKKRSDSIAAWLDECCTVNPSYFHKIGSNKSDVSSLFGSYQTYCLNTGSVPKGLREFSDLVITTLRQVFPDQIFEKKRTAGGFIIAGVSLRAEHTGDPYITDMLPKAIVSGIDFIAEYAQWLDTAPEGSVGELEYFDGEPALIDSSEEDPLDDPPELEEVCVEADRSSPSETQKLKAPRTTRTAIEPGAKPEITEFDGLAVGDLVVLDLSELDKKAQKEMRAAVVLPPDGTQGVIESFKENRFKKGVFMPMVKFLDGKKPIMLSDHILRLVQKNP